MDFLILRGAHFSGHDLLASQRPIAKLQPTSLRHSGFRSSTPGEAGDFLGKEVEELTSGWPFCSEKGDLWFSFERKGEARQREVRAIDDKLYFCCLVPMRVKPLSATPRFCGDFSLLGEADAANRIDCDVELRIVIERNPVLSPTEVDDDYFLFGEGWEEAWE